MVKYTAKGLVVKRPGVLSKVQMLTLVLGGGGLFPSSNLCKTAAYEIRNRDIWKNLMKFVAEGNADHPSPCKKLL